MTKTLVQKLAVVALSLPMTQTVACPSISLSSITTRSVSVWSVSPGSFLIVVRLCLRFHAKLRGSESSRRIDAHHPGRSS